MDSKNENKDTNSMPKPLFNASWILFIALIGIGWLLNYELFNVFSIREYLTVNLYVYIVLALVLGYIVSVIVYGLSKLIGGKILKAKLIYASFFFIKLRNIDDKIKVSFGIFIDGIGTEVRMLPTNESTFKWKRYFKSGTIGSIIYAAIMVVSLFVVNFFDKQIAYFLLIMVLFVPFIITAMTMPYRTESFSDGFVSHHIKDEKVRKIYYTTLQNELNIYSAKCDLIYVDLPNDEFDPLAIHAYMYNYYYLLDKEDYYLLKKTCDQIVRKEKYFVDRSVISLGYIGKFYLMSKEASNDALTDYYWSLESNVRRILQYRSSLDSMKTALYISSFLDIAWEEYASIKRSYENNIKTYPYQGRVEKEKKLIDELILKIEEKNPEWKDE
ncbi:MAG: hypothetical protein ACI4U5_01895 [Bacilli bacterium]